MTAPCAGSEGRAGSERGSGKESGPGTHVAQDGRGSSRGIRRQARSQAHYSICGDARCSLSRARPCSSASLPDLMMLTQKSVMPLIMLPRSIEDTTSSFFAGSFPNTTAPEDINPPILQSCCGHRCIHGTWSRDNETSHLSTNRSMRLACFLACLLALAASQTPPDSLHTRVTAKRKSPQVVAAYVPDYRMASIDWPGLGCLI